MCISISHSPRRVDSLLRVAIPLTILILAAPVLYGQTDKRFGEVCQKLTGDPKCKVCVKGKTNVWSCTSYVIWQEIPGNDLPVPGNDKSPPPSRKSGEGISQAGKGINHGPCPNWSPKFNQMNDPDMIQALRQQSSNWDGAIAQGAAQGTNIEGQIAAGQASLQQLYNYGSQLDQTIRSLGGGNYQSVSPSGCKQGQYASALGAALCARLSTQNAIYGMEGTLDILNCRAGVASGAGGQMPSSTSFGNLMAGNDPSSGAGNIETPQPPQPSAPPVLIDPSSFAKAGEGSSPVDKAFNELLADDSNTNQTSAPQSSTVDPSGSAGSLGSSDAPVSAWSDPLSNTANAPSDAQQSNDVQGQTADSKELVRDILNDGLAATGPAGETVVQTYDNLKGWADLSSPDPNVQIQGVTTVMSGANDILNTNPLSKVVSGQMISAIGTTYQAADNLMTNSFQAANDSLQGKPVSQSDLDAQWDALPTAIGKGLIPGYKYADSVQQEYQNAQQTVKNAENKVNATYQSFINFIYGRDCNPFNPDPDCPK